MKSRLVAAAVMALLGLVTSVPGLGSAVPGAAAHPAAGAIGPARFISTVAGRGSLDFLGNDQPDFAVLDHPRSVQAGQDGYLYVTEDRTFVVKRIDPSTGATTVVAGTGTGGTAGVGGLATEAQLWGPEAATADAAGNVWIVDGARILVVSDSTGIITERSLGLFDPSGIAADAVGNVYVSDLGTWLNGLNGTYQPYKARVVQIPPTGPGLVWGKDVGLAFFATADPPGCLRDPRRELCGPYDVAVSPGGTPYVIDNSVVRRLEPNGAITTLAPHGSRYPQLSGIAAAADGSVLVSDAGSTVSMVDEASGSVVRVVGSDERGFNGDYRDASTALLRRPMGLGADGAGNVYIADSDNARIRKLEPYGSSSAISGVVSGGFGGAGIRIELYRAFPLWGGVAWTRADASGGFRFDGLNAGRYRVRVVDPFGRYESGWLGGPATQPFAPTVHVGWGEAVDLPIALVPASPGRVSGTVTAGVSDAPRPGVWVLAITPGGLQASAITGPDGRYELPALPAGSYRLRFIDIDALYPPEWYPDARVWQEAEELTVAGGDLLIDAHLRPSPGDRVVETVAGSGVWDPDALGEGGPATEASLLIGANIALDSTGDVYIADRERRLVRRVDVGTGIITTIAGNGAGTNTTAPLPDGPAVEADLGPVQGLVAIDDVLYVADQYRVAAIDLATGQLHELAQPDSSRVLGRDRVGRLWYPSNAGVASLDLSSGTIIDHPIGRGAVGFTQRAGEPMLISRGNAVEQLVGPTETAPVAGTSVAGFSGDGGPAVDAQLDTPRGLAVDDAGNLFIADSHNHRIRRVDPAGTITTFAGTGDCGPYVNNADPLVTPLCGPDDLEWRDGWLYVTAGRQVRRIGIPTS